MYSMGSTYMSDHECIHVRCVTFVTRPPTDYVAWGSLVGGLSSQVHCIY